MLNDAQRAIMRKNGVLLARVLLGLLFLVTGLMFALGDGGISGFAGMIGKLGLPAPLLLASIIVIVKVLGGSGLILGYKTDLSALALVVFVLLTIVFVHNNAAELTTALKNLSIVGGLLYVIAYGPGDGWKL